MTLTEQITERLLDAVDEPGGLDAVYREFSKSRGPYYGALAAATAELQEQFESASDVYKDLAAEHRELTQDVTVLHDQQIELQKSVQTLAGEVQTAEQRLEESHESLDWLDQLTNAGFGPDELSRIHEILAQIAAENGGLPEEGAAGFFKFVERFESIISFELETIRSESTATQARYESERAVAEAAAKEVQSKARISVIDLVEDLLEQGVNADDFGNWFTIIGHGGVTVDQLAGSLEEYTNIVVLSAARQARAEDLKSEISGLEAQVKALGKEREAAHRAITAVENRALKEVKAAENQARKHIDAMLDDAVAFGDLKKEAADLGELINSARDLRSGDLEKWRYLPREVIQHTLTGSIRWAESDGRDVMVQAPGVVTQANSLLGYMHLSLRQVLFWALAGVLTDDQKNGPRGR